MKQSRTTSFLKSCVSTGVGFAIAFLANMIILPWFGLPISHSANLLLTTIYTVISIARGYALERLYEAMGWRTRMSAFALAVLAERQRQIQVEGRTPEHDDGHSAAELASGGAAYLLNDRQFWPWRDGWRADHPERRKYVIGGAMALAAGEHLDRNRKPKKPNPNAGPSASTDSPGGPPRPTLPHATAHRALNGKSNSENAGASQ